MAGCDSVGAETNLFYVFVDYIITRGFQRFAPCLEREIRGLLQNQMIILYIFTVCASGAIDILCATKISGYHSGVVLLPHYDLSPFLTLIMHEL